MLPRRAMKAVILAGGLGTRLSEETLLKPKPMVEIGGKPILWHIMKGYAAHGITDFIVCCGYRGYLIKEYFANYFLHTSDVTIELAKNNIEVHQQFSESWRVTLIDTGENTMTGGRLKRVAPYLDDQAPFCFTYGDGVSDVDIQAVVAFHKRHGRLATLTAVQPPGRFGALELEGHHIARFYEKPHGDGNWINGGFFVLSRKVIERIAGDETVWEKEPMESLARDGEFSAYKHTGYWQSMDTLRDRNLLNELWATGRAPWKVWE